MTEPSQEPEEDDPIVQEEGEKPLELDDWIHENGRKAIRYDYQPRRYHD